MIDVELGGETGIVYSLVLKTALVAVAVAVDVFVADFFVAAVVAAVAVDSVAAAVDDDAIPADGNHHRADLRS